MKKCPNCGMIVDAYNDCPICNTDITSEPESNVQIEKYRINKYFFCYLIKNTKFSLACTIVTLLAICVSLRTFDFWQIMSISLNVIMWIETLYKNLVFKIFGSIYSDEYLENTRKITIYMCGIISVIMAFL